MSATYDAIKERYYADGSFATYRKLEAYINELEAEVARQKNIIAEWEKRARELEALAKGGGRE